MKKIWCKNLLKVADSFDEGWKAYQHKYKVKTNRDEDISLNKS